jgi:hypothetical protein
MPCFCVELCECPCPDTGEWLPWSDPGSQPLSDVIEAYGKFFRESFERLSEAMRSVYETLQEGGLLPNDDDDPNPYPNGPPAPPARPLPLRSVHVPSAYARPLRGPR